jgi:hypothetical protein
MLSRREGLSDIKEMPDHAEQGGYFGAAARKKVVESIRPGWKITMVLQGSRKARERQY